VNDINGTSITVGCRVRQVNVFHADLGALLCNVGVSGTVQALGAQRAVVQFDGRTKFDRFRETEEPVADRVHSRYLEVIPE
jgi:hypothetical protein